MYVHHYKLVKNSRYDIRQHFFMQRTTDIWNSLPLHVVSSISVNIFNNNFDKFWSNHNFKCEITGIGNRNVL